MNTEPHQSFQNLIDEQLVAGRSTQTDPLLTEHLRTCQECEHYLQVNKRVIAALGEFQFNVELSPWTSILSAANVRMMPALAGNLNRKRLAQISCVAFGLFLLGSLVDVGAGRLLEVLFRSQDLHIRQGILGFWVLPSFFILLLFPMLPLLTQRQERTL